MKLELNTDALEANNRLMEDSIDMLLSESLPEKSEESFDVSERYEKEVLHETN